jgi:hypothetical protein
MWAGAFVVSDATPSNPSESGGIIPAECAIRKERYPEIAIPIFFVCTFGKRIISAFFPNQVWSTSSCKNDIRTFFPAYNRFASESAGKREGDEGCYFLLVKNGG